MKPKLEQVPLGTQGFILPVPLGLLKTNETIRLE
jgi:hypothetical protein